MKAREKKEKKKGIMERKETQKVEGEKTGERLGPPED